MKNYIKDLLPDYRIVHKTKQLIDDKINLVTKIKIKPNNNDNNSIIILPIINNNSYNEKEKEREKSNETNEFLDISKNYAKKLIRNKSTNEFVKNNFSISKMNPHIINSSKKNQNSSIIKPKDKKHFQ